jgi:hypothetical protein
MYKGVGIVKNKYKLHEFSFGHQIASIYAASSDIPANFPLFSYISTRNQLVYSLHLPNRAIDYNRLL